MHKAEKYLQIGIHYTLSIISSKFMMTIMLLGGDKQLAFNNIVLTLQNSDSITSYRRIKVC